MSVRGHAVTPRNVMPDAIQAPAPSAAEPRPAATIEADEVSTASRRWLAILRFATGFIFLWAFLDKAFGLHYLTQRSEAWIRGGSPTRGFLSSVDVGPFASVAHSIAGSWWADLLFMLGMLAVGVAVMAGIALRPAAVAGSIVLVMMWLAEFPLDQTTSSGAPSMSPNPLVDYHIIYALALIVVAVTAAGRTWGFGGWWEKLPFQQAHQWAR